VTSGSNTYPAGVASQLAALRDVGALLDGAGIPYWLFGGWAVDFHVGAVTREHDDVDLAVWLRDLPRIRGLLEADGWVHAPRPEEDGGTSYERSGVRLELTFLVRAQDGSIAIPFRHGPGRWAEEAFGDDVGELDGVGARLISRTWLMRNKRELRGDPADAAKDRADYERLSRREV
jgi:hypothetical protein